MNVIDHLNSMNYARDQIFKYFGISDDNYHINNNTDVEWYVDDGQHYVYFGKDNELLDLDTPEYVEEIESCRVFFQNDFTAIITLDCCGDNNLLIFDNTRRVKEVKNG